jgi:hypothetical protein
MAVHICSSLSPSRCQINAPSGVTTGTGMRGNCALIHLRAAADLMSVVIFVLLKNRNGKVCSVLNSHILQMCFCDFTHLIPVNVQLLLMQVLYLVSHH